MKISIITVCFNSIKYLKKCINSIQSQSYKNIEHIVIDGASTDGTLSLLESKSDQFKVLVSEPDNGIYDAMNKGIKLAKGDVVAFLNSDDFYSDNLVISKIAKLFLNKPQIDACYSDLVYVDQVNTSKIIRYVESRKFKEGLFSKGWSPPHPTFFVRRSIIERHGNFDLDYLLASDNDLMMRFLEVHKINSHYIPEVLVNMRIGGVTNKNFRNIWLQNLEIIKSLKKNGYYVNYLNFFTNKIISRLIQIFKKKY